MTGSTGGGGYSGGGYDYGGGYGGYGGSEPSEAEQELIEAQKKLLELQTGILTEQRDLLKTFMPFIAEQSGYTIKYDNAGKIIGLEESQDPDAVKRRELESGLLEQSLKALRGELPVSPSLERALSRQEEQLRERLSSQFGTGYETSSPGIESLQEFQTSSEGLREDVRRGMLTQSEQLSQARGAEGIGRMGNVTNTALGAPLNIAQLFGGVAQGYAQAQQPYTQSRLMAQQIAGQQSIASMNNNAYLQAQQGGNSMSSLLPLLLFSDERMKTDISSTGLTLNDVLNLDERLDDMAGTVGDTPVKRWRYKDDPPGTVRFGPMAQDLEKHGSRSVVSPKGGRKMIYTPKLEDELRHNMDIKRAHDGANAADFLRSVGGASMTLNEALGRRRP